ncbi:MAG: hypothetical protein V4582_10950 [Pseudomonadota bacterium]
MFELNQSELSFVSGGDAATNGALAGMAGQAARVAGAAFIDGVITGAELGAAGGPIGVLGGILIGGAVGLIVYRNLTHVKD